IGLGMTGHERDLPLLLPAASAADTATRLVALSAIAGFSSPAAMDALRDAATDRDSQVSTAAIGFLAPRPEQEATASLVGLLAAPAPRARAAAALAVPSPGRVPGLLAALETASDELAPQLTSALARLHRPDATAALFHSIQLDNVAARKAAAT